MRFDDFALLGVLCEGYGQARETGTMWQICVLTGNGAHFGRFEGSLGFSAIATQKPGLCYKFQ